ncbi:MAG: hypothetical protein WCI02_17085 [Planctomycetota bacterium]
MIGFGQSRILTGLAGYGIATGLAFWNTTAALVVFILIPLLYVVSPVQRYWVSKYGLQTTTPHESIDASSPGNEQNS